MVGTVAAVDLGATSGRVMLGRVGPTELSVRSVARFPNNPVRVWEGGGHGLHWNILELYRNVLDGLAAAVHEEPVLASVGVDSWAVDYALLSGGRMRGIPYHYRDERTAAGVASVHEQISQRELYAANGLQFLPFNTLYQFAADQQSGALEAADSFLLIPDLFAYWLTGRQAAERTNASTTGLLTLSFAELAACAEPRRSEARRSGPSASSGTETASSGTAAWNDDLIARLGLPRRIFPELIDAGIRIGRLLPGVAADIGAHAPLDVTAVGSHDTASAVVAVPMTGPDAAYISCGTWGLVGVELEHPVLTDASREANFTNEGGVDGRVRYLRNVMGLWLLSESMRTWQRGGEHAALSELLAQAAAAPSPRHLFDADDPRFLTPGDMPARIDNWFRERHLPAPASPAETVRCILESLADAFANAVRQAGELSGTRVTAIHIVGGGSQNELLCQLTADRSELPVLAGPVEATAIGNVLVQARAQEFVTGDLEALRALVARAFPPRRYLPRR